MPENSIDFRREPFAGFPAMGECPRGSSTHPMLLWIGQEGLPVIRTFGWNENARRLPRRFDWHGFSPLSVRVHYTGRSCGGQHADHPAPCLHVPCPFMDAHVARLRQALADPLRFPPLRTILPRSGALWKRASHSSSLTPPSPGAGFLPAQTNRYFPGLSTVSRMPVYASARACTAARACLGRCRNPLQRVRIRLASLARLLLLRARRPPSRGAARCARPRATAPLHSSKPPSGVPGAMMSLISTPRTAHLRHFRCKGGLP